jgi:hypothetical protein
MLLLFLVWHTAVPCVNSCIYDIGMLEVPLWSQLLFLLLPVSVKSLSCVVTQNYHIFLKILQQNVSAVKLENDIDVQDEEYIVNVKTDIVYSPSTFSLQKAEPEVSHISR